VQCEQRVPMPGLCRVPGDLVAANDSSPRVIAYGPEATMVDGLVAGEAAVVRTAILHTCAEQRVSINDVVAGARSVVVTHPRDNAEVVQVLLGSIDVSGAVKISPVVAPSVTLAVDYSGHDLDYVAQQWCEVRGGVLWILTGLCLSHGPACGLAPTSPSNTAPASAPRCGCHRSAILRCVSTRIARWLASTWCHRPRTVEHGPR
jgi:hypothetical protein